MAKRVSFSGVPTFFKKNKVKRPRRHAKKLNKHKKKSMKKFYRGQGKI